MLYKSLKISAIDMPVLLCYKVIKGRNVSLARRATVWKIAVRFT